MKIVIIIFMLSGCADVRPDPFSTGWYGTYQCADGSFSKSNRCGFL